MKEASLTELNGRSCLLNLRGVEGSGGMKEGQECVDT